MGPYGNEDVVAPQQLRLNVTLGADAASVNEFSQMRGVDPSFQASSSVMYRLMYMVLNTHDQLLISPEKTEILKHGVSAQDALQRYR